MAKDQLDTFIEIVTPENIAFQYEVAGPFRRLPAFALDLGIRMAVFLLAVITMAFFGWIIGSGGVAVLLLLWFALEWFYGGLFETYMNGQTPGKRMLGIRVVSVAGHPIGGIQAVMRNILRGIDMMPLIPMSVVDESMVQLTIPTFAIGLVCQSLNPRFQRVGDIACGTMVVVSERRRAPLLAAGVDSRVTELVERIPPGFTVNQKLHHALAVYFERRPRISTARRHDIARHLAVPLIERFGFPTDTNYDLLLCALYVREANRGRRQVAIETQPLLAAEGASP